MEIQETFARVHIESNNGVPQRSVEEYPAVKSDVSLHERETPDSGSATSRRSSFWKRPFSLFSRQNDEVRCLLQPAEGEAFRMMPVTELLETLKIRKQGEGYLEDDTMTALDVRLRRLGLRLATGICGPLRLRMTDKVPVTDIDQPQISRHSSISISLYLVAWMLQADRVTKRDLSIVDGWLSDVAAKETWRDTAKGTFRWLVARKLILTYKRKQRTGRIKRYHNVRSRLLDLLLQLVADPEHATPRRMARLKTIYETLELDPANIHSDLHRLSTTAKTGQHAEPKPRQANINASRLKSLAESTRKAQKILDDVFGDTPEEQLANIEGPAVNPESNGLAAILERFGEKEEWSRTEAESIAKDSGMTLGAMLEQLNDLAYEIADDAVADDDSDVIYIDRDIARECLENIKTKR